MFNFKFAAETFVLIITKGLPVTMFIVAGTLIISIPLGFMVGLIRFKRVPVVNSILSVLSSFFRGTPLIILIFLLHSALPDVIFKILVIDLGWDIDVFRILLSNPKIYAIGICSLFMTAFNSEIFRSALSSVDPSQLEAAHSVGLNSFQAYIRIIIPQALVSAIPNLGNIVVGFTKGSSLIFFMGVPDMMGVAKASGGLTYMYLEAYVNVLITYVVLCYVIQKLFVLMEAKLSVYHER